MPASTTPSDPQLQSLRTIHSARSRRWRESRASGDLDPIVPTLDQSSELPLPADDLQQCQAHVLDALSIPSSNIDFYGKKSCLSLLDLLPSFMELTAARSQLDTDWTISRRWMEQLAGEFMLQSTLEAYLCFGAEGGEVVDEAFAWGYSPIFLHEANERASEEADALAMFDGASLQEFVEAKNINGKRNSISVRLDGDSANPGPENKRVKMEEIWEGEWIVNMMFRADPAPEDLMTMGEETQARAMESEIEGWQEVRSNYLKLLQPSNNSSSVTHLIQTATDYPIAHFDAKIKSFLVQLWQSIDAPVLVQLERGQLAGLSVEETDDFKRKIGLESWTKAANTAST
ncbi:hypothetical protein BDV97DRAFT_397124 [Delphinella strobiligena]|nr:hypothetical protein BDV97DRAFT_397124 [Delphinella strobiligena]